MTHTTCPVSALIPSMIEPKQWQQHPAEGIKPEASRRYVM